MVLRKSSARKKSMVKRKPSKIKVDLFSTKNSDEPNLSWTKLNELDSTCGVPDDALTKRFIEAVMIANQVKTIKGLPISKYDKHQRRAFIEYPDGKKVYV